MMRVCGSLKGRVLVLEMGLPRKPRCLRRLYRLYLNAVLPRLAKAFTPKFPRPTTTWSTPFRTSQTPRPFARLMQSAGLERVTATPLTLGATYLHAGIRPGS